DKVTERRALLARFEPGATLPPHRHVGDELIFLVEGANADEQGVVATSNMNYRPNGCVHSVTTQNGATVLAVVWGRTEPVLRGPASGRRLPHLKARPLLLEREDD